MDRAAQSERREDARKAIARVSGDAWANQVPTASGLINGSNDKHRNLGSRFSPTSRRFRFHRAKISKRHAFVRRHGGATLWYPLFVFPTALSSWLDCGSLLAATTAHLQVLAPAEYYRDFDFDWLQVAITRGLENVIAVPRKLPTTMDFTFTAFPARFTWPCPDDALRVALGSRQPARWRP